MNPKSSLSAAILLTAGLACYANSLAGAFVFDDIKHVEYWQTAAQSWDGLWGLLAGSSMRGVTNLTFVANFWLHGRDVLGYHAVNLALHLAAGLTLWGLARRTLRLPTTPDGLRAHAEGLSCALALLWLVHPLQTQAVTYIMQRSETLMGLCYLLVLYCAVRSAEGSRRLAWQLAAVAACWVGFGAKEVMATAPLAALLYDRAFLSRSWRDVWQERKAMYLGFALPIVGGGMIVWPLLFDRAVGATTGFGMQAVSPREYAQSQPGVLLFYLGLVVWPWELCLDYDWPVARTPLAIYLPLAVVAALLLTSLLAWRKYPRCACLATLVFLILAPTSSVMPIKDLCVEHRMYLPLAGVLALILLLAHWLGERARWTAVQRRWLALGSLAVVATLLGLRTVLRNEDYRSVAAMWRSTVRVVPQNARACHNLAVELEALDRGQEAAERVALALLQTQSRGLPTAEHHIILGELLARQSDWPAAIAHLQRGILQLGPAEELPEYRRLELAGHYVSLGAAYAIAGQPSQARAALSRALELQPEHSAAQNMLAELPPP